MSAATIDRRLRKVKSACPGGRGRRRRSSLEEHRREVPLKVDVWPDCPDEPGYVEVDTVAHCGGSMAGSFVWTLTMTEVVTQWTEIRAVWNKGAVGVCGAIAEFIASAPFDTRMLNSDNGGECINGHIKRHFSEFRPSVLRTPRVPCLPRQRRGGGLPPSPLNPLPPHLSSVKRKRHRISVSFSFDATGIPAPSRSLARARTAPRNPVDARRIATTSDRPQFQRSSRHVFCSRSAGGLLPIAYCLLATAHCLW